MPAEPRHKPRGAGTADDRAGSTVGPRRRSPVAQKGRPRAAPSRPTSCGDARRNAPFGHGAPAIRLRLKVLQIRPGTHLHARSQFSPGVHARQRRSPGPPIPRGGARLLEGETGYGLPPGAATAISLVIDPSQRQALRALARYQHQPPTEAARGSVEDETVCGSWTGKYGADGARLRLHQRRTLGGASVWVAGLIGVAPKANGREDRARPFASFLPKLAHPSIASDGSRRPPTGRDAGPRATTGSRTVARLRLQASFRRGPCPGSEGGGKR